MSTGLRLEYLDESSVLVLTLDRPEAMNALDTALLDQLSATLSRLREQERVHRLVRAVVVTGGGGRAFCAGADLKERAAMTATQALAAVRTIRDTVNALARLPQPTIAAINGVALGGGTELALACDLRLASATATLGLTETTLGIIPGGGGTQRLPRLVGPGRAKELIFTGRRIDAGEALRLGLVEEVCDPQALLGRALEIATRIARNAPVAVRTAKLAIDEGLDLPLDEGVALETRLYERTLGTADRLEGLAAFRQKRAPVYRGE